MRPSAPPAAASCHDALARLLSEALPQAARLLEHLKYERTALAGRDPAILPGVFDLKAELATSLEAMEETRRAICQRALGSEQPTASAFRSLLPANSHADWDRYCELLRECREANAVNGRLAQARQRHVRRALDILRGRPANDDPGVYGESGTTACGSESQVLGRA